MSGAVLSGVLVGLSLGLTGGGGSILAVPLLMGVPGLALRDAVTVSLAVVGLTALYGALLQRRLLLWGPGIFLGAGGVAGAPLGAWLGSDLPESLTLGLFSALMIFIAFKMWRGGSSEDVPLSLWSCPREPGGRLQFRWTCAMKLAVAGAFSGVLSGIFGVGGGFLVVPVLLVVTGMPIPAALATSLVAIFFISASAFVSNMAVLPSFPAATAAWFLLGGALGMTAGSAWKAKLPANALRRVFAAALVVVALCVGGRAWTSAASAPQPGATSRPSAHVEVLDEHFFALRADSSKIADSHD